MEDQGTGNTRQKTRSDSTGLQHLKVDNVQKGFLSLPVLSEKRLSVTQCHYNSHHLHLESSMSNIFIHYLPKNPGFGNTIELRRMEIRDHENV